jgi:hypothetical protein
MAVILRIQRIPRHDAASAPNRAFADRVRLGAGRVVWACYHAFDGGDTVSTGTWPREAQAERAYRLDNPVGKHNCQR